MNAERVRQQIDHLVGLDAAIHEARVYLARVLVQDRQHLETSAVLHTSMMSRSSRATSRSASAPKPGSSIRGFCARRTQPRGIRIAAPQPTPLTCATYQPTSLPPHKPSSRQRR